MEVMKKRLQPYTCELLRRPAIGVSEFAQTMQENKVRIERSLSKNMLPEKMIDYISTLNEITDACKNLNMTEVQDKTMVRKELKSLLRIVTRKEKHVTRQQWKLVERYMHLGASMYLIGVHCASLRTWACNPKWVAKKARETTLYDKQFKKWANAKPTDFGQLVRLVEQGLKVGGKKKVSLHTDDEDSKEDNEEEECADSDSSSDSSSDGREKKKKKKTKKGNTLAILSSSEDDTKRRKEKRKRNVLDTSSDEPAKISPAKKTAPKTKKKKEKKEKEMVDSSSDNTVLSPAKETETIPLNKTKKKKDKKKKEEEEEKSCTL